MEVFAGKMLQHRRGVLEGSMIITDSSSTRPLLSGLFVDVLPPLSLYCLTCLWKIQYCLTEYSPPCPLCCFIGWE